MSRAKPITPLTAEQAQAVEANIRLAYKYAQRWAARMGDEHAIEDVEAVCLYALCKAVRLYDPSRAQLSTYAWWAMRYEVHKHFGIRKGYPRRQPPLPLDPDIADSLSRSYGDPPADAPDLVRTLLRRLPTRTRRMVRAKYLHGRTLKQIGQAEGLSCERVRQVIDRGLLMMRRGRESPFVD